MNIVKRVINKRGHFEFAHKISIYNAFKTIESDWLKKVMIESKDEWEIIEKDINLFLKSEDPNKKYKKILMISSNVHLKQGGYYSWIIIDEDSKKRMILETIEEDILIEQNIINENIHVERLKEQLDLNQLTPLISVSQTIEGGKKYYLFKYSIPDGFDILFNVIKEERKKFDEIEILKIISSLFNQAELIKQYTEIEPVVNPFTVIIGEGNQVHLINLFYGIPRKIYISTDNNHIFDTSTTTNSFFNGLLMCELISKKCPIKIHEELINNFEDTSKLFSNHLKDSNISLHSAWILDRLCSIRNPEYRYKSLNTLIKDINCYQNFKRHFEQKKLINLPFKTKY